MPIPRHRRILLGAGSAALALIVLGGILGIGLLRGWFDSSNVEGSSSGFEPQEAPQGVATAHHEARRPMALDGLAVDASRVSVVAEPGPTIGIVDGRSR